MLKQALRARAAAELVVALRAQRRVRRDLDPVHAAELDERLLRQVRVQLDLVHRGRDARVPQDVEQDRALAVAGARGGEGRGGGVR